MIFERVSFIRDFKKKNQATIQHWTSSEYKEIPLSTDGQDPNQGLYVQYLAYVEKYTEEHGFEMAVILDNGMGSMFMKK